MSEKEECRKLVYYINEVLELLIHPIPSVSFSRKQGGYPVGYIKGMPDYFIPALNLYIEMKDIKAGKVKEHEQIQSETHERLKKQGSKVVRCEGFSQAKAQIIMQYVRLYKKKPIERIK